MSAAVSLRQYQTDALTRLRAHRKAGKRKLLLVSPTGSGKTVIAAHIMARAAERSAVLFIAHRRELINQTWRKLQDAGVPPEQMGVLMATDRRTNPLAPIQIASVDTLRNRELPPAGLVIVDEAHRALGATYMAIVKHYAEAGATVLGLTATPYRADGGGLGDVFEVLEVVASPSELIRDGFIIAPRVYSAQPPDLRGVRSRLGDYVESDLADAMNQGGLIGNIVEHWQKHAAGVRTVAFSVNVAHSEHIAERFVAAGIPAEHLDGETPTAERDAILSRLERGETLVVSNCGVLCEGWDQPAVKCAILARPTQSTGLYLQQAGRILRPYENQPAVILDHAGNAIRHGLPQDDRAFDLDVTKQRRSGAPIKVCPECDATIGLGEKVCPHCSAELGAGESDPIAEEPGELVEVVADQTVAMRCVWESMCGEWRALNVRRGANGQTAIKPGWIWHRFVERFGTKPPNSFKLPLEIATDEDKRRALDELEATRAERGYKRGWTRYKFQARFGHAPGVSQ